MGEEETYINIFAFKFTFRCLQPFLVPTICQRCQRHRWQICPVSLIPVAICHRCRWHRRQICRRYRWHRRQFCHQCQQHKGNGWQNLPLVSLIPVAYLPPVSLIPAAICHRCHWHRWQICRWHRWCTLTCEYLCKFWKKFEMILMLLSGAWGKVIHEKNLKQKILWHCPFKYRLNMFRRVQDRWSSNY